ncbi:hypothetical protein CCR75_000029 [Bremia lactucae]|uniref:BZIP domain-containing protein n=1 Tax=Bremia lactucae TaxID=4779 RepID=A0A976ILQ7_BRELC|nr:hypothetical protein CCR75_000029 [Bremia lactucae]
MESLYALGNPTTGFPDNSRARSTVTSYASPPPPTYACNNLPDYSSSDATLSPASEGVPPTPSTANTYHDWAILSDLLSDDALAVDSPPSVIHCSPHSAPLMPQLLQDVQFHPNAFTPTSPVTGSLPPRNCTGMNASGAMKATHSAGLSCCPKKIAKGREGGRKVPTVGLRKELLSLEEQKKQRRRSQIASSVQRHREKKKSLIRLLQTEMARLMQQVAQLRADRRENGQLVAYEEEAMRQRRKRKQTELTNEQLKQALFQQMAFVGGMRALMGSHHLSSSKTLEFHDWVHSYTKFAFRDALARRKEYVSHFSKSKTELSMNIVLKNTEIETQKLLATGQLYMGKVSMLHDGTRQGQELTDGLTDVIMRNLLDKTQADVNGDGRVIKEFTSVFLFPETAQCSLEKLLDLVFASMRTVGVYYPNSVYQSRAVDEVTKVEADGVTQSCIYYSNLLASMEPVFEIVEDDHEIKVEARVITQEQRGPHGGTILWDYVDDDTLHPLPLDATTRKTIRRNVCGGMVIRREPGTNMFSVRHTSMKSYSPLPPAHDRSGGSDAEEVRRAVTRRIGLQASECDRMKDQCTRHVYETITHRLTSLHVA